MKTAEVGGGRVQKQENLAAVLSYLNCSSLLKTAIALCSFFLGSLPPFLPEAQLRKGALSKDRNPLLLLSGSSRVFEPHLQPPKTTIHLLFPPVAALKMAPVLMSGRRSGRRPPMSTFSLAALPTHLRASHKF